MSKNISAFMFLLQCLQKSKLQKMQANKSPRICVIGGGSAGLFASHLALARDSLAQVAMFEKHKRAGGCASWFSRKSPLGHEARIFFDAGATVLEDPRPGTLLGGLLDEIRCADLVSGFESGAAVRFQVEDNRFELSSTSTESFLNDLNRVFGQDPEFDFRRVRELARWAIRLQQIIRKYSPALPLMNCADLWRQRALVGAACSLPWSLLWELGPLGRQSLGEFLGFDSSWGSNSESGPFVRWVRMNLHITLQTSDPFLVPVALGALALFFYPLGTGTLPGGMRALMEGLWVRLTEHPRGKLFAGCGVVKLSQVDAGWQIESLDGKSWGPFDLVFSSIGRRETERLLRAPVSSGEWGAERFESTLAGAFVVYAVVSDEALWPDSAFNVHVSDPDLEAVYFSVSRRLDPGRQPTGLRSVNASIHANLNEWKGMDRQSQAYKDQKAAWARKVMNVWRRYWGEDCADVLSWEAASPLTFERYTWRQAGHVGGIPQILGNSLWQGPPSHTGHRGLYLIGDNVAPGQSVGATALGASVAIDRALANF